MKQKRQEDQRCKSMKKCSKRGPKMMKNHEKSVPRGPKIEENGARGAFQMQQNTKLKKNSGGA